MSKKIVVFVRFFKKEIHRDAFLRGQLYMNRLKFFKEYEEQDGCNIGDAHEGASGWLQPGSVKLTIKNADTGEEHEITDFAGPIVMGLARHNDYHVYCMSAVYKDDELTFETFDELRAYMTLDVDKGDLGDYCVIVPAFELLERIDKALKAEAQMGNIVGRGLVEYFDPDTFCGHFEEDEAIMRKKNSFSHQKEYRVFVYNGTSGNDARTIELGDISDIAHCCEKRDFHKTFIISQNK